MATAVVSTRLSDTDGYVVESPEGDVGRVEEVWLGASNMPRALAVRTADGRHGLLMDEQILAVDREHHWVVVPAEATLLELDVPRLVTDAEHASGPIASWATTGARFPASVRRRRMRNTLRRRHRERPLWQSVATLLGSIAFLVALTITLAFLVARLVTGHAY